MKQASFKIISAFMVISALSACNSTAAPTQAPVDTSVAPIATQANAVATPNATALPAAAPAEPTIAAPTENPAAGAEGEGAGGEAPLVPYADTAQGFSIDYPKPWTQDPAVKDGVKFDGDGTMTLTFVKADAKNVMAFATADAKTFAAALPAFNQVGLAPSTEVEKAVVLAFETTGTSNVTGKTYKARGDRYYIGLNGGRIAILTVISPLKNYDREGVRDIALTLKVTK